jgi:ribosomal protein L16/L10AE
MGKGKGSFDQWGTLAPASKMLFEISSLGIRIEIAKEVLVAAGKAIPGPVQFVNEAKLTEPAIVGLSWTTIFHAGIKVDGPIDTKK